jgi:hypothetical protein
MNTSTLLNGSGRAAEIRRIVQAAKSRGALQAPGEPVQVKKEGEPAAALGGVRSQWIDVTPAMASDWLHNNFRNRPVKQDVVQAYARDMLNGTWAPTHQGLAFNDRDELIDGQHRLLAIVLSGRTIRIMVTFGLPAAIDGKEMTIMDTVDRGATRSVADQLAIQHGFKNAGITAAICRSIAAFCSSDRTRRLSVGQTLAIFRIFEESVLCVIDGRVKEHGLRQAGVLAGFAIALAADPAVRPLYTILLAGDGPAAKKGSALRHLRTFLLSEEAKLLNRGTDRGLSELVLQAIYLERQAKSVARLDPAPEGADHYRAALHEQVAKVAGLFRLPELAKAR